MKDLLLVGAQKQILRVAQDDMGYVLRMTYSVTLSFTGWATFRQSKIESIPRLRMTIHLKRLGKNLNEIFLVARPRIGLMANVWHGDGH